MPDIKTTSPAASAHIVERYVKDHHKLGIRLRSAREKAGLTQAEVAEAIGVSNVAVSNWERGVYTPEDENLLVLARLYHRSPASLRYGIQTHGGEMPTAEAIREQHDAFVRVAGDVLRVVKLQVLYRLAQKGVAGPRLDAVDRFIDMGVYLQLYLMHLAGEILLPAHDYSEIVAYVTDEVSDVVARLTGTLSEEREADEELAAMMRVPRIVVTGAEAEYRRAPSLPPPADVAPPPSKLLAEEERKRPKKKTGGR